MRRPRSASATVAEATGPTVEVSTTIAAAGAAAASSRATSTSTVSVGSEVNTIAASASAFSMLEAAAIPRPSAIEIRSRLTSKPATRQPAAASRAAIGSPMSPSPSHAIRLVDTNASLLAQHGDARLGDLLVLVRLHARDPDRADALAVDHDRQAALDRRDAGHLEHRRASALDAFFPHRGRAPALGGGAALLDGDARVCRRRAVHAEKVQQVSADVDERDADVPVVLPRLGFSGGRDPLAILECEHGARFHTRTVPPCRRAASL